MGRFKTNNYVPAFVSSRTAKQTAPCQSAGDEPQKCVRLLIFDIPIGC